VGFQREPRAPFGELATDPSSRRTPRTGSPAPTRTRGRPCDRAEFFARHGIDVSGAPKTLYDARGAGRSRLAYLTWERPARSGPSTVDADVVWNGRVAAYDRDIRRAARRLAPPSATSLGIAPSDPPATSVFSRQRLHRRSGHHQGGQGELDLRSADDLFHALTSMSIRLVLTWAEWTCG
jgi:hypothetical protein